MALEPAPVSAWFRLAPSLARALEGARVQVGTLNAAKLAAVRAALASLAAEPQQLRIVGVEVASGVAEQPVGWEEISAGARNRARAAFAAGEGCALAVGIEDGLVEIPLASGSGEPSLFNVGCAWLTDGLREGSGFSSAFAYPPAVSRPAWRDGSPIGALFDDHWREERSEAANRVQLAGPPVPSGRQGGNIGQLTQGRLDRSAYGAQAVLCALVPFLHVDLYD